MHGASRAFCSLETGLEWLFVWLTLPTPALGYQMLHYLALTDILSRET